MFWMATKLGECIWCGCDAAELIGCNATKASRDIMSARNVLSTTIFCIKKITFDFSEKIKNIWKANILVGNGRKIWEGWQLMWLWWRCTKAILNICKQSIVTKWLRQTCMLCQSCLIFPTNWLIAKIYSFSEVKLG